MTEVRPATEDDLPRVLELLQATLGWVPDAQYEAFFRWKHLDNPFGRSPAWLAEDDGRLLAFRTFLRWEWERDGEVLRAVRAVDTATHPDAQGRGLFRTLTMHALDAMHSEGVAFVFNTPNDQSRPGYLKMGWHDVGRPPVRLRPRGPRSAIRAVTARVPADKWSLRTDAGVDATEGLRGVGTVLARRSPAPPGAVRTNHTEASLLWRYGFGPLAYRAVPVGAGGEDGLIVFRLRRRGPAVEAAVTEVLASPGSDAAVRRAIASLLAASRADYAIALGPARRLGEGLLPLPRQGPRLTWRAVVEPVPTPLESWHVSLGDIELF